MPKKTERARGHSAATEVWQQHCLQVSTSSGTRLLRLLRNSTRSWPQRPDRSPHSRCALLSSRLPVALDRWDASSKLATWLSLVRQALRRMRLRQEALVIVDGTTGAELMLAAANRMQLPTFRVEVTSSWNAWKQRALQAGHADHDLIVSPPVDGDQQGAGNGTAMSCRDELLWSLADRIEMLYARPNGTWQRWLEEPDAARPMLTVHASMAGAAVASPSARSGVVSIVRSLSARRPQIFTTSQGQSDCGRSASVTTVFEAPLWESRPTLVHWTRAAQGPWPLQSWDDFWVQLLWNAHQDRPPGGHGSPLRRSSDRSALGALQRIVQQQRIFASSRCIRDGHRVVCLTALPPTEFAPVYRRHRRRWDASGYGIAISRSWLAQMGARPVVYGDEQTWQQLQPGLRPFFQAEGKDGQWRGEHEWRLAGDLLLSKAAPTDVQCIVPTENDRECLLPICPWTVTVVQR